MCIGCNHDFVFIVFFSSLERRWMMFGHSLLWQVRWKFGYEKKWYYFYKQTQNYKCCFSPFLFCPSQNYVKSWKVLTVLNHISDFKPFSCFCKNGKSKLYFFLSSSPHKQGMLNLISVQILLKHREGFPVEMNHYMFFFQTRPRLVSIC